MKTEQEILWDLVLEYREQIEHLEDMLGDKKAIISALMETNADLRVQVNGK